MIPRDPSSYIAQDLADPHIDPAILTQLAQHRPDLWPAIASHPRCHPELAAWISWQQSGPPAAPPPAGSQPAGSPNTGHPQAGTFPQAGHPQAGHPPQAPHGQARPAQGSPRPAGTDGVSTQQMAQGAKQFAAGAKGFMTTRVAPATASAARAVQHAVKEQAGQARTEAGWIAWLPFGIPLFALLGLIGVFLPAGTASASSWFGSESHTSTFFDEDAGGIGVLLLLAMLLVLAGGILAMVLNRKGTRIGAAVAGIVVGLFAAIIAFSLVGGASGYSESAYGVSRSVSVGPGTVLLAIASVGMLAASVIALLPVGRKPGGASRSGGGTFGPEGAAGVPGP